MSWGVRASYLLLPLLAAACRHASPVPTAASQEPPPAPPPLRSLPEVPGFVASPQENADEYVRRSYTRGSESITVTLANVPMSDAQYREWERMSLDDFPQARLDVPPGTGHGFYECEPGDPSRCNLLVQLRCGAHLEIRGSRGVATRAGADALARALPLRALAGTCRTGG